MSHALGVFWAVMHRRPQDYAYFEQLQPPVVKIQDGGPPDYAWVREHLPNALVLARDWALGEQHDDVRRDPVATGRRHAQEWRSHADRLGFDRANTLVLGLNEPHVWEDFACVPYTVAFLDECTHLGLRGGALQLSVGWPANTGPDTPPDWTPYAPVRDAILRGRHALVCHEYWADGGPSEKWGWWGGRTLRCPWDVPLVIGECGFEMAVKTPGVPMAQRGWQAHISAETYAGHLIEYANRMAADRRILGVCPFLSDFANNEWASLDLEPAYGAILARRNELRPLQSQQPTGPVVVAPAGANVRLGPDTATPILRRLPQGTPIQPIATNAAGTWLLLGDGGWLFRELAANVPGNLPIHGSVYVPIVVTPGAPADGHWPAEPPPKTPTGIVDPLVLEAILKIESGGRALASDGKPIIRFEAHVFRQQLSNDALFAERFRYGTPPWTGQEMLTGGEWHPIHTSNQSAEWTAYSWAAEMNAEAAAKSISIGAPQLMGFHHARIGYPSAQAMLQAFHNASVQVIGFLNFLLSDDALWGAVNARDWRTIARQYNGAGAVDTYAPLLERTYNELKGR